MRRALAGSTQYHSQTSRTKDRSDLSLSCPIVIVLRECPLVWLLRYRKADSMSTPSSSPRSAKAKSLSPASSPTFPAPRSSQNPPRSLRPSSSSTGVTDSDGLSSSDEGGDESVWWTPRELRDILDRSTALKLRANATFGRGDWNEALVLYREALVELPVRSEKALSRKRVDEEAKIAEGEEKGKGKATKDGQGVGRNAGKAELEQEDKDLVELGELRAVLFANVAACLMKLVRSSLPSMVVSARH